ncbi:DUF6368 family protein [Streptomyces sp. NPDC002133]|uniref:DUF6368 family protein n=1 Tax=Streptomyces sp. NPDC002133 TaxID=3154409 RepID=UPI00332BE8B2
MLVIGLANAALAAAIRRLRGFLIYSSTRIEEMRAGEYALHVQAEGLGITNTGGVEGHRPFLVSLMGPRIGDESVFDAEHSVSGDHKSLSGYTPTHAVDVIAFRNRPVDHVVTTLLTAAIIDEIGGIANAELREDQLPIVAGLPGLVITTTDPWPAARGSATFLRARAEQPGFRILK